MSESLTLNVAGARFAIAKPTPTLYSFEGVIGSRFANAKPNPTSQFSGGYNEKVTPVPIPNTAVKLLSAQDTWLVTARENRSLPDLYQSPVLTSTGLCAIL